jgi:pleiotropic regulator 1
LLSGSHDNTAKCWDLVAGKALFTLTNHKKAVRDVAIHPKEYTFLTAAADNLKVF